MRLFLAIYFPTAILNPLTALTRRLDGRFSQQLRVTVPEQLHLTLCFLGDVAESMVPDLSAALAATTARHNPFLMELAGVGRFPDHGMPRVVWAGMRSAELRCERLQEDLGKSVAEFGVAADGKPFTPHITVARVRRGTRPQACKPLEKFLEANAVLEGRCEVASVDLVVSHLLPQGARHEVIHQFSLGSQ